MVPTALTVTMAFRTAGSSILEAQAAIVGTSTIAVALENALTSYQRFIGGCHPWCNEIHILPILERTFKVIEDPVIASPRHHSQLVIYIPGTENPTLHCHLPYTKGLIDV